MRSMRILWAVVRLWSSVWSSRQSAADRRKRVEAASVRFMRTNGCEITRPLPYMAELCVEQPASSGSGCTGFSRCAYPSLRRDRPPRGTHNSRGFLLFSRALRSAQKKKRRSACNNLFRRGRGSPTSNREAASRRETLRAPVTRSEREAAPRPHTVPPWASTGSSPACRRRIPTPSSTTPRRESTLIRCAT